MAETPLPSEAEPPAPGAGEVRCKQCRQPIPADARLCVHCKSHQDWRGHLSISSTILALLVALLSVLTVTVPPVINALRPTTSRTIAADPIFEGNGARVVVSNRGEEPATIHEAYIALSVEDPTEYLELHDRIPVQQIRFRLTDASSGFLPKGNAQLILEARPDPHVSAEQADAAAEYFYNEGTRLAAESIIQTHEDMESNASTEVRTAHGNAFIRSRDVFRFYLVVVESDGRTNALTHAVDWHIMGDLLRGHAERCRSLREQPSLTNGCLPRPAGTGDAGAVAPEEAGRQGR
jgi:hypothetical protein